MGVNPCWLSLAMFSNMLEPYFKDLQGCLSLFAGLRGFRCQSLTLQASSQTSGILKKDVLTPPKRAHKSTAKP